MGDVGIRVFKKLICSHSGAEIWRCFWNLEVCVSLLLEMGDLPAVWLARLR